MKQKTLLILLVTALFLSVPESNAQGLKDLWKKSKNEVKKIKDKNVKKATGTNNKNTNSPSEKADEPVNIDFGPMIDIKAPNQNFDSFQIQSWKGLMRLGVQYDYGRSDSEYYNSLNSKSKTAIGNKGILDRAALQKFRYLSELKYLKEWYDVMDKEYFTSAEEVNAAWPRSSEKDPTEYNKLKNSQSAQLHLRSAAFTLLNKRGKNSYFCNSERGDCVEVEERVFRTDERGRKTMVRSGIGSQWGGTGSTEFAQLRNFNAFTEEEMSTLQKWSNDLWKNGFQEFYCVQAISQGTYRKYDFKQKGYWMRLDLGVSQMKKSVIGGKDFPFSMEYVPKYRYEKERETAEILFKISPDKAEKMASNRSGLKGYAVYKIKVMPNGINQKSGYGKKSSSVDWTFHLTNPVVELYSDLALKNKIGEISFEDVIYK